MTRVNTLGTRKEILERLYDAGAASVSENAWIPVNTEADLPDSGRYLFTLKTVAKGQRLAIFNVKERPWLGVKVLAWMPLPEPYKQENQK